MKNIKISLSIEPTGNFENFIIKEGCPIGY